MIEAETIVVGGGPAGSSCAWELARHGRECLLLERQALPKFKLCAGWITPKVLRDLEIAPEAYPHGMVRLERMRVYFGRTRWRLEFPTLQYSIRRVEFDNWLLRRCRAEIRRHAVRSVVQDGDGFVLDGTYRCRHLVGAGGTRCPVRRALFEPERGRLILTLEIEYETATKDPLCTLFYPFGGKAGYGWYVPKAGAVNIGFGGVARRFGGNIRRLWPGFVRTLRARGLVDADPPAPAGYPYYVGDRRKELRRGNAFIVGDAAGLATVDMGEGIGPAVESGLAAARAICREGDYSPAAIAERTLGGLSGRVISRLLGTTR